MIDNIEVFTRSAVRIDTKNKIMYFDPYGLREVNHDADIIFFPSGKIKMLPCEPLEL